MEPVLSKLASGKQFISQKIQNVRFRISAARHLGKILPLLVLPVVLGIVVLRVQNPVAFLNRAAERVTPLARRESPKYKGYIIQYQDAKTKSSADRSQAKNDLINRVSQSRTRSAAKPGQTVAAPKVTREFTRAFNGVAMDISDAEAQSLKGSPYVKNVYPNLEVRANLMDSVPLIKANQVWNTNIVGSKVNVAVIDTGVDYMHQDLGKTVIQERPLTKVSKSYISSAKGNNVDHIIAINNGILAYPHDRSIYLDALDGSSHQEIPLYSSSLMVGRIAFDGQVVAYFAVNSPPNGNLDPAIYAYNSQTKEHKKIASGVFSMDALAAGQGQIVYMIDKSSRPGVSAIYTYDFAEDQEKTIDSWDWANHGPPIGHMRVNGDTVAYPAGLTQQGAYSCYAKIIIYSLSTGVKKEYAPPDISFFQDVRGSKIAYTACSNWSHYHLYDLSTGADTELFFDLTASGSTGSQQVKKNDGYFFGWTDFKAEIGDNVVFFNKDLTGNRIVAYDLINKRYAQINVATKAFDFATSGNRVCFVAGDSNIYCHDYSSTAAYPLPSNDVYNLKVVSGYNFINQSNDPLDDNGHGTHVAGIVAGSGIVNGVGKGANIVAYKVLNSYGTGYFDDVIAAIDRAVGTRQDSSQTNDISVINLSLGADCKAYYGGYTEYCGPDDPVSQAVDRATVEGITTVAAAGNSGDSGNIYTPGVARTAITVGAVDKSKRLAYFSSKGPVVWKGIDLHKPDLVAPGSDICSAVSSWGVFGGSCLDSVHGSLSGTSMATPHVAGVVALVKQSHPDWTPAQIKQRILSSADNLGLDANSQGAGLINAYEAAIECSPTSCPSGCCKNNICETGTAVTACGTGGATCSSCDTNYACTAGKCVSTAKPRYGCDRANKCVPVTCYPTSSFEKLPVACNRPCNQDTDCAVSVPIPESEVIPVGSGPGEVIKSGGVIRPREEER